MKTLVNSSMCFLTRETEQNIYSLLSMAPAALCQVTALMHKSISMHLGRRNNLAQDLLIHVENWLAVTSTTNEVRLKFRVEKPLTHLIKVPRCIQCVYILHITGSYPISPLHQPICTRIMRFHSLGKPNVLVQSPHTLSSLVTSYKE